MLIETRHDLDEVARLVAIIELMHQNFVPGILTSARRAGQTKNVSRAGKASRGA